MANRTPDTVKTVRPGPNGVNSRHFYATWTGTWANSDTIDIIPEGYEVGGWIPGDIIAWSDGAGDVGARTRTLYTKANITPATFIEATGTLRLTNVNAGNITNPKFLIELIGTSPL